MDSRLEIDKLTGKELGGLAPMKPELVGGKTHQCRPQSKIDPSGLVKGSHPGVNDRKSGSTFAPGFKKLLVEFVFSHSVKGAIHILEFDLGLGFKFLNEVAVPCKPALEMLEARTPGFVNGMVSELLLFCRNPFKEFGHGKRTPRQIRTHSSASIHRAAWRGEGFKVILSSFFKKCRKDFFSGLSTSPLRVPFARGRKAQIRKAREDRRSRMDLGGPGLMRRPKQWSVQDFRTLLSPTVTILEPSDYTELPVFEPRDILSADPLFDADIALIGPKEPCLLVAVELRDSVGFMNFLQRLDCFTCEDKKGHSARTQIFLQLK
jgi:hypothetical protein